MNEISPTWIVMRDHEARKEVLGVDGEDGETLITERDVLQLAALLLAGLKETAETIVDLGRRDKR